MKKKGFEIQFNWVFVLVAGAAILLFFTVFIYKQRTLSEVSTKTTILKSIEAIIIGAGVSIDTTRIVDVPNANIEVECNRVSIGGVSKQYQNLILFAPSLIKGDRLITQTLAFSLPYRATNLLYITSDKLRYIIIGDSEFAEEINKSLPTELKKEFYPSSTSVRNLNNYKVRFVVFENPMIDFPLALQNMQDSDVTALHISGDSKKGSIDFYGKNSNIWQLKGSSFYIGKQALIGAVYSDTNESYECNMKHVFARLKLITKIYKDKTQKLHGTASIQCQDFYNKALPLLEEIDTEALKLEKFTFDQATFDSLTSAAEQLNNENKEAQKSSCTLIY